MSGYRVPSKNELCCASLEDILLADLIKYIKLKDEDPNGYRVKVRHDRGSKYWYVDLYKYFSVIPCGVELSESSFPLPVIPQMHWKCVCHGKITGKVSISRCKNLVAQMFDTYMSKRDIERNDDDGLSDN
jgi:hypothetical protein